MSGGGIRDGSGGPRPLDVDDQQMWDAARRAPLSTAAMQRIAAGVTSQHLARAFAWRELGRWRVWVAAALLLLIGGAAGAAFVIRRPNAEASREAAARAAPARGPHARSPEAPAVAAVTPVAASAPQAALPPVPARALPVPVASPVPAASAPQRKTPPVQLALRAPAAVTRTIAVPVAPSLAPAPEPLSPSPASAEAGILRAALTALHRNDDPAAALALLDQYDARFPKGTLRGEATLARAHSLRELGRDDELLRLLERVSFADVPRAAELRVLRGELRLTRRRFSDALADFEAGLVAGVPDPIVERALFGRASCRSRLGDADGARVDLRHYLERFPASPRAAEVRARLAR